MHHVQCKQKCSKGYREQLLMLYLRCLLVQPM
uniref:Uncharacterized protein n=1 Tax=Setaria italica TaxID=4555 RepID=K3Z1H3_SETIT